MKLAPQHRFDDCLVGSAGWEIWRCTRCGKQATPNMFGFTVMLARYLPFCSRWRCDAKLDQQRIHERLTSWPSEFYALLSREQKAKFLDYLERDNEEDERSREQREKQGLDDLDYGPRL